MQARFFTTTANVFVLQKFNVPPNFTETYYFLQLGLSESAEIAFFPYFHLIFVPVNSKILLPPVEIYITF